MGNKFNSKRIINCRKKINIASKHRMYTRFKHLKNYFSGFYLIILLISLTLLSKPYQYETYL